MANSLTREEEYSLVRKAKNGDDKAKAKLLKCHEGIICNAAKRFSSFISPAMEFDDLVQEARIAVLIAISKFKISKNVRLMTYATLAMRRRLYVKAITDGSLIAVPSNFNSDVASVARNRNAMELEGTLPTSKSLRLPKTVRKRPYAARAVSLARAGAFSIDVEYHNKTDKAMKDNFFLLPDYKSLVSNNELYIKDIVKKAANKDNNYKYLAHYFGLFDFECLGPTAIAKRYNTTRHFVNKSLNTTLENMKQLLREERLVISDFRH